DMNDGGTYTPDILHLQAQRRGRRWPRGRQQEIDSHRFTPPAYVERRTARRQSTACDFPVARVQDRLRVDRFDHVTDRKSAQRTSSVHPRNDNTLACTRRSRERWGERTNFDAQIGRRHAFSLAQAHRFDEDRVPWDDGKP